MKAEGLFSKYELTKTEFSHFLRKALLQIFEGAHKDHMKSTLSLRAIVYEQIIETLDQASSFADD